MENIIPFTKEITFDNKISEITSISLEEDYKCIDNTIDGKFKVFGDYKTHELSVNKEDFSYELPFSVDLTEKIDIDTLSLEITDFSYDILNEKILKVNIEFKVNANILEDDSFEEAINAISEPEVVEIEDRISENDENTIIDSISEDDKEFITYHIHIVKESETIESICALYNSNTGLLSEYNDLTNFKVGDKLLVVEQDE